MGAWIETTISINPQVNQNVAPYVGAWIETFNKSFDKMTDQSHPTWVRGLKQTLNSFIKRGLSRTLRGCVD